jgi:hypothetical protein
MWELSKVPDCGMNEGSVYPIQQQNILVSFEHPFLSYFLHVFQEGHDHEKALAEIFLFHPDQTTKLVCKFVPLKVHNRMADKFMKASKCFVLK